MKLVTMSFSGKDGHRKSSKGGMQSEFPGMRPLTDFEKIQPAFFVTPF